MKEAYNKLKNGECDINEYTETVKQINELGIVKQAYITENDLKECLSNENIAIKGLGFPTLESYLNMKQKDFMLIYASTGGGKTALVVSAIGYKTIEKPVTLVHGERIKMNVMIDPSVTELGEVVVVSNGVSRVKRSAFNAIAVDTKEFQNSTKNLSDALAKAPGMKLRESGGVGSDMQLMLDGFSGKHVKIFIDGVPQEGVGSSFGLNNIPVNFADRIEVYKGVVPVGFGTDAIGGVINIVTNKKKRNWFLDGSYSYGSFNTHKSYVNFGQTFKNGFTYEINAFQNYSDNDYQVDAPVEDFETGRIDKDKRVRVKRFNDTYRKRDRLSDLSNEKDLTDEPADNIRAESRNIAHAHNDWECTFAGDLRVCHTW